MCFILNRQVPDGCMLGSNHEMCDTFRTYFHDHSVCSPDLPVLEFRSYLANFPHFWEVEAASCEGLVTECKVCDALKHLNKSPGRDNLPYKVYLRLPHMFVPISMDMFSHWFTQGAIPGSITKGMITWLKKCGRHAWEDLDRLITLLNTELKILARVLAKHLLLVISDLIRMELWW